MLKRRKTRQLKIGDVKIGGGAAISIQSMTKTDTKDAAATLGEIKRLCDAGCEIVRIAIKDAASIKPFKEIVKRSKLPIEADIHFIPQLALDAITAGAAAVRLNPGNINRENDIKRIAKSAKSARIPIRIGVNSGSLVPMTLKRGRIAGNMAGSALTYAKVLENSGFGDIMISLKSSDVLETVEAYRMISALCDYPLHLGVTAAGPLMSAAVKSAIGIGSLLLDGIGDTIRVSLTASAIEEVRVAKEILTSLKLRHFGPEIISCPTCGRCQMDLVKIVGNLQNRLSSFVRHPSFENGTTIAVMGCEVNGPGEAANADIGIACGKNGGVLFRKGKIVRRLKQSEFVKTILREIRNLPTHQSRLAGRCGVSLYETPKRKKPPL